MMIVALPRSIWPSGNRWHAPGVRRRRAPGHEERLAAIDTSIGRAVFGECSAIERSMPAGEFDRWAMRAAEGSQ